MDSSFDANTLFGNGDRAIAAPARASQPFSQSVLLDSSAPKAVNGDAAQGRSTDDSDVMAAHRLERLARAVRERESKSGAPNDARAGLEALCRGAGFDAGKLLNGNAGAMLQIAGRLLREALISLKEMDAKQADFRRQFRLPPVRDEDRQPFKLAATIDELLPAMFASHDSRRLDAGQWLRACFEQQSSHQDGLVWGARAGFVEFMRQLSPAELERRFQSTAKRGASASKANIWELYAEFHRSASEVQQDTGVPSLYAETLANAYGELLKKHSTTG